MEYDLKNATKNNAKCILKNLSLLNKWCKNLSPRGNWWKQG